MKVKIVHIASSLSHEGTRNLLSDLIKHLEHHTFKHAVMVLHKSHYDQAIRSLEVAVHYGRPGLIRYDPLFWFRYIQLIRHHKPDCIHTIGGFSQIIGRIVGFLLRIPVIDSSLGLTDLQARVARLLHMMTVPFATKIVAHSQARAQELQRSWVPAKKICVIPQGIDLHELELKRVQHQKTRYELGLSDEHIIIGAVGARTKQEYQLLVDSFVHLNTTFPLARLLIMGLDRDEKNVREQAAKAGIETDLLFIAGNQPYGYYTLFDCYIGFSRIEHTRKLLEAMSIGLACIVIQDNASYEPGVITDGIDGLVVSLQVSAVVKALEFFISNDEIRQKYGLDARKRAAFFTLDKSIKSYEMLFSSLNSDRMA